VIRPSSFHQLGRITHQLSGYVSADNELRWGPPPPELVYNTESSGGAIECGKASHAVVGYLAPFYSATIAAKGWAYTEGGGGVDDE